jgi:hypothetical protein
VGILSSALPGFRDLRAPLVAGYLWLLFVWLLIDPELPPPANHGSGFVDTLLDLGDLVGRVGIALAVSIAAYLIGAISATLSQLIAPILRGMLAASRALVQRVARSLYYIIDFDPVERFFMRIAFRGGGSEAGEAAKRLDAVSMDRVGFFEDLFSDLTYEASELESRVDAVASREAEGLLADSEELSKLNVRLDEIRELARSERANLGRELRNELDLPATLLIGDQPETFAEADRIRAESELRFAVVPPLAALAVLFGEEANSLWYFSFIGILALAVQGVAKQDDARNVIAGAMLFGKAKSAALERWDRAAVEKKAEFDKERSELASQFDEIRGRLRRALPAYERPDAPPPGEAGSDA